MNTSPVNVSKLRTTKEKVYYVIVFATSLSIWMWIGFSVYRQFTTPQDPSQKCYVQDPFFEDQITAINKDQLLPSEKCLKWEDLTQKHYPERLSSHSEDCAVYPQKLEVKYQSSHCHHQHT